ncbi:hypothetical protein DCAR_0418040 [Daucus carota subsp. sativus]|uniref:Uncharacterized protein n=1 Tax=Daucus carota subsp. sativus TaxID=79200 RepID=A0AAF0X103_DAUCS|nr:hypothetical protein DCAR_0418040 [Daucus carota subsp. sativus]
MAANNSIAAKRLIIILQIILFLTCSANSEAWLMIHNRRSSLALFHKLGFKLAVHDAGATKRLVPSGPNPETSPGTPPSVVAAGEVKRLVPTGPNPETSPGTPPPGVVGAGEVKRLVPTGPNPETSPGTPPPGVVGAGEVKRLVPTGPDPIQRLVQEHHRQEP